MRTQPRARLSWPFALALGLTVHAPAWGQTPAPAPRRPRHPPPRSRDGHPGPDGAPPDAAGGDGPGAPPAAAPGGSGIAVGGAGPVPQARSNYYPRFDLQTGVQTGEFVSSTTGRRTSSDSTFINIQGRQLIYDFGKTAALVDEAQAGSRVAAGELERVRDLVVQNVRQAYFGVLQARRLVAVADAALAPPAESPERAGFFDVGTKPKSDVTRAEVEVANARVGVIRARNRAVLRDELRQRPRPRRDGADRDRRHPHLRARGARPGAARVEALGNRPELRQAQARLDASRAQLAGARASISPTSR